MRALTVPAGLALGFLCASGLAPAQSLEERDVQGRVVRRADGERVLHALDDAGSAVPLRPRASRQPRRDRGAGSNALQVREEWRWQVFGTNIGESGLHAVDVDADGDLEVVAANGQSFWYVLEHQADDYRQSWASDPHPESVDSVQVAQLDADPALEIVVGIEGQVFVYDGVTHVLQSSFPTAARTVFALTIADVDGDGGQEAVFCDDWYTDALYVHDLASGAEEYRGPGYGCRDLAVGNVDTDLGLEIVVGRGTETGYVLDGATRAVEWANFFGFGDYVRIANLDGLGANEIVTAYYWQGIALFDATQQSLFASLPTSHDIGDMRVFDVEGDGPLEIVYGDGQWGEIHVHNGQTLAQKWIVDNPEHGVSDIALGDVDQDGRRELLWGAGGTSSGSDHLHVADTATHLIEWSSLDVGGPFTALAGGDVDADGRPEILHGSATSQSYGGGVWFVHDALDQTLESYQGADSAIRRLRVANVDSDPQLEIFLLTDDKLLCLDGITHAVQWSHDFIYYDELHSLAIGNVDADPGLEAVVGMNADQIRQILVLDAAGGGVEWTSPGFGGGELAFLRLANVDADPNVEIVAGSIGNGLFVVDGLTHVFNALGDHDVRGLDTVDLDGAGPAEIVVAGDTTVRRIAPNGSVVSTLATFPYPLSALVVRDVSGDGTADYVVVAANELQIRDGETGATLWVSGPLLPHTYWHAGQRDALLVEDIDGDGRLEILVDLGYIGIREFEIPSSSDLSLSVADAPDPALVGGNLTYTWTIGNPASVATPGVVLDVALPSGALLVSTTPGPPSCTTAGGQVSCALGTLGGASSSTVTVVVSPQSAGTLVSSGTVTSAAPDPQPADNQATAQTVVTSTIEADLALAVDDGRALVQPGDILEYRIDVTNLGPWSVSSMNVAVTVPPALLDPAYIPEVGTYDPGTGAWTGLSLGAGGRATLVLTATVSAEAMGALATTAMGTPPAGVTDLMPGNNAATDVDLVTTGVTELSHGSTRRATVDASGDRYFALRQQPGSSYEVVVDEVSGDLGDESAPVRLQRLGAGLSVVGEGGPVGVAFARSLRWQTMGTSVQDSEAIRVRSAGCATDCGGDDVFRIRAYDTTYDVPRFNNAGSISVLILQNTAPGPVNGTVRFWSAGGTALATASFSNLAPRGVYTLITPSIPGLGGQSGSITVTSDAPYGALAGKVVSVEPATGFSFDTPLRTRPR